MVTGLIDGETPEFFTSETAPEKQDRKLNKALGRIFAAASEGPLPVDKALSKTFDRINDSKVLSGIQKSALFGTIIDRLAPEDRANISYSVYRQVKDEQVKRHMAARVFSDIELLDDSVKFAASLAVIKHFPAPSEDIAQRIANSVDALPQEEQPDALVKLYKRMPSHREMLAERILDKVPCAYSFERHDLAMAVYSVATTEELRERALAEALKHVDDAPAKTRTEKAVEISFLTKDPVLLSRAVDVAIDHATIPNKSTIKALEESLKAIQDMQGTPYEDVISSKQIMAIETALY